LVKKEIRYFEDEGEEGIKLQLICDYLSTIAPSSMEFERAFSAATHICTKIRSSLNDNTVDCWCFLRAHFIWTGSLDA
jgi:hypothetical protein